MHLFVPAWPQAESSWGLRKKQSPANQKQKKRKSREKEKKNKVAHVIIWQIYIANYNKEYCWEMGNFSEEIQV